MTFWHKLCVNLFLVIVISQEVICKSQTDDLEEQKYDKPILEDSVIWPIFRSEIDQKCTINLENGFHKSAPPLIVDSSSSEPKFLYPASFYDPKVEIQRGQTINIYCPGKPDEYHSSVIEPGTLEVKGVSIITDTDKPFKCIGWNTFNTPENTLGDKGAKIEDFSCVLKHVSFDPILRPIPNQKCGRGDKYEIGFDLGSHGFLRSIDLCHDKTEANTLWSHHVIHPLKKDKNYDLHKDAKFKKGMLYEGMDFIDKNPYDSQNIHENFLSIFGSDYEKLRQKYPPIEESELTGGQLISTLDKFHLQEQETTFFFANVVPMWRQLRNITHGNWHWVEEFVRRLAFKEERSLDIWSGGFGVLHLQGKKIYMDVGKGSEDAGVAPKVPVPKHLYQCIVDKKRQQALCIIVTNNPYITIDELNNYVCTKLTCNNEIMKHFTHYIYGWTYCCTLQDFYTKNKEHLGLEDIEPYLNYEELQYTFFEDDKKKVG